MFARRVVDRDGDVWRVRVRMIPPLPPLPRLRERIGKVWAQRRPYGVAESHYRLSLRPGIIASLIVMWPLLLLAHRVAHTGLVLASLARRLARREPWFVVASRAGRERSRTLEWRADRLSDARDAAAEVAAVLEEGEGLYDVDEARLLSRPLFLRR